MAHDSDAVPLSESGSAPVLHIQLLGNFRLVCGDQPVTSIEAPRLQALLAYLILHRDAPQSRQHIAFLLYPDSSEAQARTNLRNQMHYLRKALPAADRFLIADAQTLQWNSDAPFTLDVDDFENLVAHASSSAALREAVNLYGGELLPGCYDDWILPEREQLRQKFVETLERLILLLENRRDYRAAISFTERLLRQDPLREETYRRLMRLYVLSGDNAGARRVYQTCIAVLKRELDAEPSAETRAEFERITNKVAPSEKDVKPDFPPPQSALTIPNTLPVPLTSFIGREQQIADLKRLLSLQNISSRTRLVTFTGAGGSGKTRLAIQVANELLPSFQDGVWFVDLAPLADPALIPQAIAAALSVHEQPGRALLDTLLNYLRGKELLLLLDNCEQFVAACAELVQTLLEKCPRVQIIATSRERLNLAGETVWLVPTLSLPDADDAEWIGASHSESVHLFVERAVSALPTFALTRQNAPAVAQICRRLDGIPLAIELAAARIKLLTPTQIASRLDDAFHLLTRGSHAAPPRQQTLRAAMDWSYELLSAQEQMLFRRLSVFAGGFTLESAEEIVGEKVSSNKEHVANNFASTYYLLPTTLILDLLSDLVDKSLVVVSDWEEGEQVRYRLLEPVRQYGYEQIERSGEARKLRCAHLDFFTDLAETADEQREGSHQELWLTQLERAQDDIRAALSWVHEQKWSEAALRLSGAMGEFWERRGHWKEGREWIARTLELDQQVPQAKDSTQTRAWRARALMALGKFYIRQGAYAHATRVIGEGLALYQALTDQKHSAELIETLGWIAYEQGNEQTARTHYEMALTIYEKLDDEPRIANALSYVGLVLSSLGEYEQARERYQKAVDKHRALGNQDGLGFALGGLGNVAHMQQDYPAACAFYEQSLANRRHLDNARGIAAALVNLGTVQLKQGTYVAARASLNESLELNFKLGNRRGIAYVLGAFAHLAHAQNHVEQALELLSCEEMILREIGGRLDAYAHAWDERLLTTLREEFDSTRFANIWERGQNQTLEQAVKYALEQTAD